MAPGWFQRYRRSLVPDGSLRARLASGVLWSGVAAGLGQGSTLVVSLVTARLLGPSAFGALAVVTGTVIMLGSFAGLGLGLTATKYVAELKHASPVRAASVLALVHRLNLASCLVMTLAMVLLAPWLAEVVFKEPALVDVLRLGAPLVLLNGVIAVQVGALAGYEAFRDIARISLLKGLLALPVSIVAAAAWGVPGAIGALIVVAACNLLLGSRALRAQHNRWGVVPSSGVPASELSILHQYSLPAFLGSLVVGPVGWIGAAMLVNQPDGYQALGVFNAANQWRTTLLFIPAVAGTAIMPVMASLLGKGSARSAYRVFIASIPLNLALVLPFALLLFLLRDFVMSLYGPEYAAYGAVLGLVAVTVVLIAPQLPVGQLLAASGRMWIGATLNLAWACVFVAAAAILLPMGLGAAGLAAAYLVAYAFHTLGTVLVGWYLARRMRLVPDGLPQASPA